MTRTAGRVVGVLAVAVLAGSPARSSGDVDEPLELVITSVAPSFRATSLGPEFLVLFVNAGAKPIPVGSIANTTFVEAKGVRYRQGPVLAHAVPPLIEPRGEGRELVRLGAFGIPLSPGMNTITILVGGVRTSPVHFLWNPDPPEREVAK